MKMLGYGARKTTMLGPKTAAWFFALVILFWIEVCSGAQQHQHHGSAATTEENSGFFHNFLKVYTPRQQCMDNEQPLVWLHFVADFLIGASYYSIPFALVYFIRKRMDLHFNWVWYLFAVFILA